MTAPLTALKAHFPAPPGPLTVRVKEPSIGLFYWVVIRLSAEEHTSDLKVDASDHPYPTHEAALRAGSACLKALKADSLMV